MLGTFTGTVLLVSHDRSFLNNVVTSTFVLEGDGTVGDYVGGYDDWVRQRKDDDAPAKKVAAKSEKPRAPRDGPRKLSYKEERELETLPERIEALEAEQTELHAGMADPAFYQKDGAVIARAKERLETIEEELLHAYARWEALDRE